MDSGLFTARIEDTLKISRNANKPKFLGFLSKEETVFAKNYLKNADSGYSFFGGFDGAQRTVLACFPEDFENVAFPISAVTFTFRKGEELHHRDFLGSLMALGITRESVGDILIEECRAVVFVMSDVCDYVVSQIYKIGKVGVKAELGFSFPLPKADTLSEFSATVASERLDCVVSALAKISRKDAAFQIESGLVAVNSQVCQRVTKAVGNGDVISVRGSGKFIIEALNDRTKKDRIVLKYKKYI